MPVTRLRTGMVGMEEMTLGHFMIILGGGQVLVLRGISDRGDRSRHREGGGRKKWADKCFNSCSTHPQNDSEEKNCSIYLPFPSIYLASSIHQYLSFPRGLRHVWQFILLNYISIPEWREARLQRLTLTSAQCHLVAITTPPPPHTVIPGNTAWCLWPVTVSSLKRALPSTTLEIHFQLPLCLWSVQ